MKKKKRRRWHAKGGARTRRTPPPRRCCSSENAVRSSINCPDRPVWFHGGIRRRSTSIDPPLAAVPSPAAIEMGRVYWPVGPFHQFHRRMVAVVALLPQRQRDASSSIQFAGCCCCCCCCCCWSFCLLLLPSPCPSRFVPPPPAPSACDSISYGGLWFADEQRVAVAVYRGPASGAESVSVTFGVSIRLQPTIARSLSLFPDWRRRRVIRNAMGGVGESKRRREMHTRSDDSLGLVHPRQSRTLPPRENDITSPLPLSLSLSLCLSLSLTLYLFRSLSLSLFVCVFQDWQLMNKIDSTGADRRAPLPSLPSASSLSVGQQQPPKIKQKTKK